MFIFFMYTSGQINYLDMEKNKCETFEFVLQFP